MSRGSVQSVALLAIVAAAVINLEPSVRLADEAKMTPLEKLRDPEAAGKGVMALAMAHTAARRAMMLWPGRNGKDNKKVVDMIRVWDKIPVDIQPKYRSAVLISMCERALIDLLDKLSNKRKRTLVGDILVPIIELRDMNPVDGEDMYVPEQASILIDQLQVTIGWEY